ncbi:MAG: DsbA family protein [Plesiomonas sp.]
MIQTTTLSAMSTSTERAATTQAVLHYIYDPLCGWCYGAAPLIDVLHRMPELDICLHAGGLWVEDHRPSMGESLRDYVQPHDLRIAELTGQPFGEAYFNQLLLDSHKTLDSTPPIRAILAVQHLQGDDVQMLFRIQQSHYRDGLWVGDEARLARLAAEQGIAESDFLHAYQQLSWREHMAESHAWLARLHTQGYPTVALQLADQLVVLPVSRYFGDPLGWQQEVQRLLSTASASR